LHYADDDGIVVAMEAPVMAPAPVLTADQYFRTPETLRPAELVYGALRVAEAPSVRHQQAVGAFFLALSRHVHERRLGRVLLSPVDVVLDYERALIVQPDLLFVSQARTHILQQRVLGAPDLVVEVLSPNPRIGALQERVGWFAGYGVREIWLLHQLSDLFEIVRVEQGRPVRSEPADYSRPIRSDVLPGFTNTVGEILEE
jgi:Uma2 family endonuclease